MSGVPAKVMCHIGGVADRALMSQMLDLLRPGDILTHCFSGAPNIAGEGHQHRPGRQAAAGRAGGKAARRVFDIGHGGGSFDYTIAEAAIAQGCPPDTISSDIHVFSGNTPGMPYLPWVMSKLIGLGFSLEQVVAMATSGAGARDRPHAEARHAADRRAGRPVDPRSGRRSGRIRRHAQQQAQRQDALAARGTVVAGVAFGRPYQSPFATR